MVKDRYVFAVVMILLLVGFAVAYIISLKNKPAVEIIASSGKFSVAAEVADEPEEWATGLMFRKKLDENRGMLFIFPDEQTRGFWMKNTLIPLDIIFISSNFTIVDIKENFSPCESDTCPSYASKNPAKYVLEVNAGLVGKNNIEIGNKLSIK